MNRSHYGWMALGGLLCLFGVVAFCKWRDSSRVFAQSQPLPPINTKPSEPPTLPPIGAEALRLAEPTPPAPTPASEITLTAAQVPAATPAPPSPGTSPPPPPPFGSDARPIVIPPAAPQTAPPPLPIPKVDNTPPVGTLTPPPPPVEEPKFAPAPPPDTVPPKSESVKLVEVKTDPLVPTKGDHPNEPPLAPTPGPVITYRLIKSGETFRSLARKTLHNGDRWSEIHKLNPTIKSDAVLIAGTVVRLPADACIQEEPESMRPLPSLRPRPAPKAKVAMPLTGTYPLTLDDNKGLTLPKAVLNQLGNCDSVLVSPGSDKCLWITNQAQLDRLSVKLEKSPARDSDVRNFKRLYYAQTVKVTVKEGRIVLGEKLTQFANLHQELVLVGIDDHFEVWDAARWRRYTQAKKATTFDE